jgi:hypothetical protein
MRRSCSHLYQETSWKSSSTTNGINVGENIGLLLSQIEVKEDDFKEALKSLNFGAEKFDIYQPMMKPLDPDLSNLLQEPRSKCISWLEHVSQRIGENGKRRGSSFGILLHSQKANLGASQLMADILSVFRKKQEYHIHSLNLFQLIFNVS